jgi:hypothetical protein
MRATETKLTETVDLAGWGTTGRGPVTRKGIGDSTWAMVAAAAPAGGWSGLGGRESKLDD